ncbi:MAG TPA: Holliday junction resolvase RuvX [Gammaproteobacteria bacterium]|nr:Holliday junction resolvase RuvX [Gammaproteobacteria bacterium]
MSGARTVLGFDYGSKRIGVAVGQELTQTATALETLRVINAHPDWAAITRLIDTWKPAALVVGMPASADGAEHAITRAARRFSNQLHGRYRLPVHTVDERLSSYAAQYNEGGSHNARNKGADIDRIAAQIILQTWLTHAHKGNPP